MTLRFVHAADLHLDSPLRSLALRAPQVADLVATASRSALEGIVDLCLAERVDALLLAGDLYDRGETSMKTARFLAEQLGRLHRAGIAVHIIRGNHDALSVITRELVLPESVHIHGERAQAVPLARPEGAVPVVLHGISFPEPQVADSLLPHYARPTPGAINVGLMHTSLNGSAGHETYAPVSAADLGGWGFDYWALGHIHKAARQVAGRAHLVMPGIPQGRDVGEPGPGHAALVSIAPGGAVTIEDRRVSLAEFARVTVDATGVQDWRGLVERIRTAFGTAREDAPSPHLIARVTLTGQTPLAFRIRRDLDLLRGEAENAGEDIGRVWIERVDSACTAQGDVAGPGAASGAPLAELARIMRDEVLPSAAYAADLRGAADELLRSMPADLRHLLGDDPAAFQGMLDAVAAEGADEVLADLWAEADPGGQGD